MHADIYYVGGLARNGPHTTRTSERQQRRKVSGICDAYTRCEGLRVGLTTGVPALKVE